MGADNGKIPPPLLPLNIADFLGRDIISAIRLFTARAPLARNSAQV